MSDDCRNDAFREVVDFLEGLEGQRPDSYLMWSPRTYVLQILDHVDEDRVLSDELLERLLDKRKTERWDILRHDHEAATWLASRTERLDLLERLLVIEIGLYHPSLARIERYRVRVDRPLAPDEAWRVIKAFIKNINDGTTTNRAGSIVATRDLRVEEIRDFAATHLGPGVGEGKINELIADRERILSYSD